MKDRWTVVKADHEGLNTEWTVAVRCTEQTRADVEIQKYSAGSRTRVAENRVRGVS